MPFWKRKRDANDKGVAKALRAAGAFVEVMGDWDFTVKYPDTDAGQWFYIDAKNADGKGIKRKRAPKPGESEWRKGATTARQQRLLDHGFPLVFVSSIAEALAAIGAPAVLP